MEISWINFFEAAKAEAESWSIPAVDRVILGPLPIYEGLRALVAALILGLDLVFDEKGTLSPGAGDFQLPARRGDTADFFRLSGRPPQELKDLLQGRIFTFATSGSTGLPKLIAKAYEGLANETVQLKKLYALQAGDLVSSLVRPFHIYGFLHSFLLPLYAEAEVLFWNTANSLPALETGYPQASYLLITVPAHFNLLTKLWEFSSTHAVVSSGAPLGETREKQIERYATKGLRYWEILGSTETGGIAHRRADLHQDFEAFPGLRFEALTEGTRIYSPFLAPEESVISQDILHVTDEGKLIHQGRADRVFKYGGLRYTLGEIERTLSELCAGVEVICAFEENRDLAQGGILSAWIEGEAQDLRPRYPSALPFPKRLVFLKTFPRDSQGKVSLSQLKGAASS